MIPYVLSADAEAACAQVYRTLANYLVAENVPSSPVGRPRLSSAHKDRLSDQRDSAVIRIVSITEAFCGDLLLSEVEADMDLTRAAQLVDLWEKAAIDAVSSWEKQIDHYKKWLGVTTLQWTFVKGVAVARNAVVHGLGKLTRMQLQKRASHEGLLQAANITLVGTQIEIDTASLRRIADGCVAHIRAVDEAVSTRPR